MPPRQSVPGRASGTGRSTANGECALPHRHVRGNAKTFFDNHIQPFARMKGAAQPIADKVRGNLVVAVCEYTVYDQAGRPLTGARIETAGVLAGLQPDRTGVQQDQAEAPFAGSAHPGRAVVDDAERARHRHAVRRRGVLQAPADSRYIVSENALTADLRWNVGRKQRGGRNSWKAANDPRVAGRGRRFFRAMGRVVQNGRRATAAGVRQCRGKAPGEVVEWLLKDLEPGINWGPIIKQFKQTHFT